MEIYQKEKRVFCLLNDPQAAVIIATFKMAQQGAETFVNLVYPYGLYS